MNAILSKINLFNLQKKYWNNYILEPDGRKRIIDPNCRTVYLKIKFFSLFVKRCVIIPYMLRQPTLSYSEESRGELKQVKKNHRSYEDM